MSLVCFIRLWSKLIAHSEFACMNLLTTVTVIALSFQEEFYLSLKTPLI